MGQAHAVLLKTVVDELDKLIVCRRIMDAEEFIDNMYNSFRQMDMQSQRQVSTEISDWIKTSKTVAKPKTAVSLLDKLGDKPSYPVSYDALCRFKAHIESQLPSEF